MSLIQGVFLKHMIAIIVCHNGHSKYYLFFHFDTYNLDIEYRCCASSCKIVIFFFEPTFANFSWTPFLENFILLFWFLHTTQNQISTVGTSIPLLLVTPQIFNWHLLYTGHRADSKCTCLFKMHMVSLLMKPVD